MNTLMAIKKNTSIGFVTQIIILILNFLLRSCFLKYLGTILLGLNNTFASLLSSLALAELGFQTAVVYELYKPMYEKNEEKIKCIISILRRIYDLVGVFILIASICVTPFLGLLLKGIEINLYVYLVFYLQTLASVFSYFFAYKRTILYVDQKQYVTKLIDTATVIIFDILQILSLVFFKSYVIYLIFKIVQVVISNVSINIYVNKNYDFLIKLDKKIDKKEFSKIINQVKNIFVGRIAGYIYSSTDNLVISGFIGTLSVGYYANYLIITNNLKTIIESILSPIMPIIGRHLIQVNDNEKRFSTFSLYTYVRFIIACMIVIPFMVLCETFITMWIGEQYILSKGIVALLGADLYIHIVHSALLDYINGTGLFKQERNVEIVGALSNLSISLILVKSFGIEGVLIGTIVSQIIFWIGRSWIVFENCFKNKEYLKRYFIKMIEYITFLMTIYLIVNWVAKLIAIYIESRILFFMIDGFITEVFIFVATTVVFRRTNEGKIIKSIFNDFVKKLA